MTWLQLPFTYLLLCLSFFLSFINVNGENSIPSMKRYVSVTRVRESSFPIKLEFNGMHRQCKPTLHKHSMRIHHYDMPPHSCNLILKVLPWSGKKRALIECRYKLIYTDSVCRLFSLNYGYIWFFRWLRRANWTLVQSIINVFPNTLYPNSYSNTNACAHTRELF